MDEMTRSPVIECNICRGKDSDETKKGIFGSPNQNIYTCRACGHIFLAPLPDDAEEEKFYINDYPAFLLKRGDFKSASPDEHFVKNKTEAVRRFGFVKSILLSNKNVLEIGSASGFFLDYIKPYVNDICGIEPNSGYLEYSCKNGINTYRTVKDLGGRKFDIVFLYYVLEHVKDPGAFIKDISALLKDGNSRIVLEVPNVKEALVSLYHAPAYNEFVWQRAHCSYFSTNTLDKLLKKNRLNAEFISIQRYDFSNHIYWLVDGKPGGAGKYSSIFSETLNKEYAECLKKTWLCDSILAIAKPAL